jgi:hypothetical protein
MVETILEVLLPVVFGGGLGLLAAHFGIIGKTSAPMFADFGGRFALPARAAWRCAEHLTGGNRDRPCCRSGGDKIRIEAQILPNRRKVLRKSGHTAPSSLRPSERERCV